MEKKVLVVMKDIQRYKVLTDVIEKKIKGNVAAKILGITYVHVSRLKKNSLLMVLKAFYVKLPTYPPKKIGSFVNNVDENEKSIVNKEKK